MSTGKLDIDATTIPIKTTALGSKGKIPLLSALVSARIEEYGFGMSGYDDECWGYLDETGETRKKHRKP